MMYIIDLSKHSLWKLLLPKSLAPNGGGGKTPAQIW